MRCEICGKECARLGPHLKLHNTTGKEYYDKYLKQEHEGFCVICGKPTRFSDRFNKGYYEVCDNRDCRNKLVRIKSRQTCLERYGNENYNNHEKQKQTCLERYGTEDFYKSEHFKKRSRSTKKQKYNNETFINPNKIWETRKIKISEFENRYNCTSCKRLTLQFGQGWYSLQLEKIYYNGSTFISNDDIPLIEEYISVSHEDHIRQTKLKNHENPGYVNPQKIMCTKRDKYGTLAVNVWAGKHASLNQFAEEHNCTSVCKLLSIYGQDWLSLNLPKIYANKQNCFISNQYIPIIEQYASENHSKSYSKAEKEIVSFIQGFYSGIIIENTRKVITPQELDIYLPDLNLAIEYNGINWHSITTGMSKDYHLNKSLRCRNLGIRLIHIYEFENFGQQLKLLKDLILGIDNYPKNDYNKNNLLPNFENVTPKKIYKTQHHILYGVGYLDGGKG